jgi:hypothetical protein
MKRNAWKHAPKCIIEHLHPAWGKANYDSIYQFGNSNWAHDEALYLSRLKLYF